MNLSEKIFLILAIILFGVVALGAEPKRNENKEENHSDYETITVKDKERVVDRGGKSSRYLVWSEEETFENVDSLVFGKFNSSDLQGKLEISKTYKCKIFGVRVQILSMYRNLIDCDEVK